MNIQPVLENEKAILYPLQEKDVEALYAIAPDSKIWEQHPDSDRWKKEVFKIFLTLQGKATEHLKSSVELQVILSEAHVFAITINRKIAFL